MMIFILVAVGLFVAAGVAQAAFAPARFDASAEPELPVDDLEEMSPTELAAVDPLEALRRYGTPGDAARLAEQGVDLGALGYRAPSGD